MFYRFTDLKNTIISNSEGDIGELDDLLISDNIWVTRYLVADIGSWLKNRKILLPPTLATVANDAAQNIIVDLSKSAIEESPPLTADQPVSREYEVNLSEYYRWMPYWAGIDDLFWGGSSGQAAELNSILRNLREKKLPDESKPQLRSCSELLGYYIKTPEGQVGHVEDFLIDREHWFVPYLIVDTRNWLPGGKKVLVSVHWVDQIRYEGAEVILELSKRLVENSPAFNGENLTILQESGMLDMPGHKI